MLNDLKPISENHSIKWMEAAIFTPQSFITPQDVFEKVRVLSGFTTYPSKKLIKPTTININREGLNISNQNIAGFAFESYKDTGDLEYFFKVENFKENRAKISLENHSYRDWRSFKKQLDANLITFSGKYDFYPQAISLSYQDEFLWQAKEKNIPVKSIFNINAELLNNKFFNSTNGSCIILSQGREEGNDYEERIEISFNNEVNRIVINHRYTQVLDELILFSEQKTKPFSTSFNKAHQKNKKILGDILTQETQHLINLK